MDILQFLEGRTEIWDHLGEEEPQDYESSL